MSKVSNFQSKKINTFGTWKQGDATTPNLHTGLIFLGQYHLNLGEGFGSPGHLTNAKSSFGQQFEIGAGLRTGLQKEETVQHLLASCVVARQVWFKLLHPINLGNLLPRQRERSFADWWRKVIKKVPKDLRKGVNSLIILGAWMIWKHRNACVFEGVAPSVNTIMRELKDELSLWCLAGAKKLLGLGLVAVL